MRWGLIAVALAWCAFGASAHADEGWIFGSVVCEGDRALVRFTEYDLENGPEFQAPPAPYAARFAHASNIDPSQCRLRNGRLVALRQTIANDGMAYSGPGAGTETQSFWLTVGDRTVYGDVLRDRSGDQIDLVLVFDHGTLTACRTQDNEWREIPLQCTDVSDHLPGELAQLGDLRPYYALASATPDLQARCAASLPAQEPSFRPPHDWPTFVSIEPRNSVSLPGEVSLPERRFDLDNNGQIDDVIAVSNEGTGYFDGGFFMLPPAGVTPTQQQIEATSQAVIEGQAAAARARGWRIYAGDQTSFREARYTRLWPFALDGQTYFMASWAAPWANPRKIILRPTPAGLLEEVCVFELRH